MLDEKIIPSAFQASYQPAPFKPRPPRKRTCLSGKLIYGDDSKALGEGFTLDCGIRDLSEGGARITVNGYQPLPPDVWLIMVTQGIAYRSKIVWMNYPARGLSFLQAYFLRGLIPDELRYLRYLWTDLSPRSGSEVLADPRPEEEDPPCEYRRCVRAARSP